MKINGHDFHAERLFHSVSIEFFRCKACGILIYRPGSQAKWTVSPWSYSNYSYLRIEAIPSCKDLVIQEIIE